MMVSYHSNIGIRPGLTYWAVRVGFMVDKVALGPVFLSFLGFYPVSVTPPPLHTHSCVIWGMNKGPVSSPVPQRRSLT
jgi:hypothetical protein